MFVPWNERNRIEVIDPRIQLNIPQEPPSEISIREHLNRFNSLNCLYFQKNSSYWVTLTGLVNFHSGKELRIKGNHNLVTKQITIETEFPLFSKVLGQYERGWSFTVQQKAISVSLSGVGGSYADDVLPTWAITGYDLTSDFVVTDTIKFWVDLVYGGPAYIFTFGYNITVMGKTVFTEYF